MMRSGRFAKHLRPVSCPCEASHRPLPQTFAVCARGLLIRHRRSRLTLRVTAQKLLGLRQFRTNKHHRQGGRSQCIVEDSTPSAVVEVSKTLTLQQGRPKPLGPSPQHDGVNFALFSRHASSVVLCLYNGEGKPVKEFPLDPSIHRTGDVWHASIQNLSLSGVQYGYKVSGTEGWEAGSRWDSARVLLDPYAPLVAGRRRWARRDEYEHFEEEVGSRFLGTYDFLMPEFDWGEEYARPNIPFHDLIIYELPIRTFTADASSGLPQNERGTFKGLIEKIPHLVSLGVNAVELLPVFEFDELEFQRYTNPRAHMTNIWGYSHMNFFAPMSRYAADDIGPAAAAREFKALVRALHNAGIEVILDVVYNHTAESDDKDPYMISFRGIDNRVYYMVDTNQHIQLINFSGCGNTVNANHPVVAQLIIDSLRHWVEEYHVDGFRFDLASCLCRDGKGDPISAPPLIRAISKDDVLKDAKLIAEPWDLGMYQVGSFPNWDRWAEWNGKYRDDVRRFIKGDEGMKSAFATRIAGSSDLYQQNNRKPYHSINFVVAHDGFTLHDLVAYNGKHNDNNGEGGKDGTSDNFSWNCGHEGETGDGTVLFLRQRQMKNFMLALLVSQGTPMILAGDEYCHTNEGNNNWYGQDSKLTYFHWDELERDKDGMSRFLSELIEFRREHPLLGQPEFLRPSGVTWHEDNWDNPESKFLAFTLHGEDPAHGDIYCAFNAHEFSVDVRLPDPPKGCRWARVVDTNLAPPKDFTPGGNKGVEANYAIMAYSSILLLAKQIQ